MSALQAVTDASPPETQKYGCCSGFRHGHFNPNAIDTIMNASLRRVLFAAALSFTVAVGSTAAWAQASYPAKPITLVVAYPAGGDTDALARLLAEKLSTRVGQPVIVDNRPGASGTIGSAYVSRAAADGYTLLFAPSTFSIAQFVMKTTGTAHYDVLKGFTPIVQTGAQSLALVVGPGTSARSPKELVAEARRSGPLGYPTPGAGSPMHIPGELFNRSAGVKLNHVPYKGVAPAINDVLGGHVASTFITLGPVLPNIASGKLAILAIATRDGNRRHALKCIAQRSPELGRPRLGLLLCREILDLDLPWLNSLNRPTRKRRIRIRTGHELLGHSDVSTTIIYTDVLQAAADGTASPPVASLSALRDRFTDRVRRTATGREYQFDDGGSGRSNFPSGPRRSRGYPPSGFCIWAPIRTVSGTTLGYDSASLQNQITGKCCVSNGRKRVAKS